MIEINGCKLYNGDCFDIMPSIPDKSVDAIICDLPYGTTACKWDTILPFDKLWSEYNRIIKDNGAIVLFGSQPFTSALVMSNPKMFRYEWVWCKNQPSGQMNAKKMPLKSHEVVSVFYKNQPTYNPIMTKRTDEELKRLSHKSFEGNSTNTVYGDIKRISLNRYENEFKYPTSQIHIKCVFNRSGEKESHPTQKPVSLLEYLIKTYTNEGETVLDNTMGSGTTMVGCINTNRKGIGIEKEKEYFDIAVRRCSEIQLKLAV